MMFMTIWLNRMVGETYRIDLLQTKYLSWLLNTLPNFFHLDMTWLEYMYCWSIAFCKQRFTNNDGICKRNTSIVLFSHIRIFKISGSTDMFCRGCSSECNVKDVLMNQIWIDYSEKFPSHPNWNHPLPLQVQALISWLKEDRIEGE